MRKKSISSTYPYYLKDAAENHLVKLDNRDLKNALRRNKEKKQSGFDEDEFQKTSDISSMYASIKKTIISQDEQIMQILTALFKNQKVINSDLHLDLIAKLKENILIYGSTGTGKTEILKRISNLYNIPIVIEDATSLSEKAEDHQSHVSRLGVQRSLLKLLDGTLFYFKNQKFNTSKLTVVALGAFTGIVSGDIMANSQQMIL